MDRFVYYGVKDGEVVSIIADMGQVIADDIADAIRAGEAIYRAPLETAPALFDPAPDAP